MKQCPKCQASISDTAKFCMECGCNIKKYEEEHSQPKVRFCPECGTEIPRGSFCPECGYNISQAFQNNMNDFEEDIFGDGWLAEFKTNTDDEVASMIHKQIQEQFRKDFLPFEYEEHADGTYTIIGLKDKTALQYTVPSNVVSIADEAFSGCNAIEIVLPEGLLQIGNRTFKNCRNLKNINVPKSLILLGDEVFLNCAKLDIELPTELIESGIDIMKNTAYETRRVKEVEDAEDELHRIRQAEITRKIEEKKRQAEERKAQEQKQGFLIEKSVLIKYSGNEECVIIPSNVSVIGKNAFTRNKTLKCVIMSDSVKRIDMEAFAHCSALSSVQLSENLTTIGEWAFFKTNIGPELYIPNSVTDIKNAAFCGCEKLKEVRLSENLQKIRKSAFAGTFIGPVIQIPYSVKEIEGEAFRDCKNLTQVMLPKYVKYDSCGYFSSFDNSCKIIKC